MKGGRLIRVAPCIYQQAGTRKFFQSVRLHGKAHPTKRKLNATTLTAARAEVETINTRRRESQLGVGTDPYAEIITVGQIAESWLDTNCQDRDGLARTGQSLAAETARLERLLPFWRLKSAREIVAYEDCAEYHQWRLRRRKSEQYGLGRSVDAELTTLSNLLQWAAMNSRRTGIKYNPLATRPHFNNPQSVRHCTEVMPATDEVFHQIAEALLAVESSRAIGWQYLLEGLTGCRTSEILACRVDATVCGQPGFMDSHALHLHRLKDGIEPWALLEAAKGHDPLRDCLQSFLNWHEQEYPNNPHFIPGRNGRACADRCSLTHALHRICKALELPLVTSHGLRAYHVACLRSMGLHDEEIAARLGHRSTQQVQYTYGTVKPGFRGSWQMDMLPEDKSPAWAGWRPKITYQKLIISKAAEAIRKQENTKTQKI